MIKTLPNSYPLVYPFLVGLLFTYQCHAICNVALCKHELSQTGVKIATDNFITAGLYTENSSS
jgi:hypothetical protein